MKKIDKLIFIFFITLIYFFLLSTDIATIKNIYFNGEIFDKNKNLINIHKNIKVQNDIDKIIFVPQIDFIKTNSSYLNNIKNGSLVSQLYEYHWGVERLKKTYNLDKNDFFRLNYFSAKYLENHKIDINKICNFKKKKFNLTNFKSAIYSIDSNSFVPAIMTAKIETDILDDFLFFSIYNKDNKKLSDIFINFYYIDEVLKVHSMPIYNNNENFIVIDARSVVKNFRSDDQMFQKKYNNKINKTDIVLDIFMNELREFYFSDFFFFNDKEIWKYFSSNQHQDSLAIQDYLDKIRISFKQKENNNLSLNFISCREF